MSDGKIDLTGPFMLTDYLNAGGTKYELAKKVKTGEIERINRGLYQSSGTMDLSIDMQFRVATFLLRNTQSAICLNTALSYHDLSDTIIERPTLLVQNAIQTKHDTIRLFRKINPKFDIGILKKQGFSITSVERTVIESLVYTRYTAFEGNTALRNVILQRKTTLDKLFQMARDLGLLKKVEQKLEVFV